MIQRRFPEIGLIITADDIDLEWLIEEIEASEGPLERLFDERAGGKARQSA